MTNALWQNAEEAPRERTTDVYRRRLRMKLGRLARTLCTLHGLDCHFHEHLEVIVRTAPVHSI